MELSQSTKKLISQYQSWQDSLRPQEGITTVHVDEVASKVAVFYEQIRTIIDWKEEHLMRRAAIIRKLKRRFLDMEISDFSTQKISEPLIMELIRGGYFPNDKIEESKVTLVQAIIEKYIFILKNNTEYKKGKTGVRFYSQVLEIAACEIEETLAPSVKEMALIDFMFSQMKERIKINESVYKEGQLTPEEKDIQIYIAVQKALFKLDEPIITYNLLRYKFAYWQNPSPQELNDISRDIYKILETAQKEIDNPLQRKFYVICERYDTPYLLLGDILSTDAGGERVGQLQEPSQLEGLVRNSYAARLKNLRARIQRAAFYSVASIFITKILSLIILEIILAKILNEQFNFLILTADVLIPTVLMLIIVLTVRLPSRQNVNLAVMETVKIAYPQEHQDAYSIKIPKKRSLLARIILSLIYLAGAVVSFGCIYLVLNYLQFPLSSIIINMIFISLILFAGRAIQRRAKELTVQEEKGGILSFISDILILPVTELGRWLSNTWRQYNAIAAFFNALIDMPFSAFVEFLERWRYFINERKEELQ